MNWLLVIAVLVILYLCRGKKKVLVSGVIIGLVLCWFMGSGLVEGFDFTPGGDDLNTFYDKCCNSSRFFNRDNEGCEDHISSAQPRITDKNGGLFCDSMYKDKVGELQYQKDLAEDDKMITDCCPPSGEANTENCLNHVAMSRDLGSFFTTMSRLCN